MDETHELISSIAESLEKQRGVPTYLLFSEIGFGSLIKTRRALQDKPHAAEVDIILHSPGGQPSDAYRLIRTFRERYDTVNIIVPFWAKSAATLFAFGGSRVVLHEFGELGPLDAQIKKDDEDKPIASYASALNVQSSLQQIEQRSRLGMLEMLANMQSNPDVKIARKPLAEMLLTYSAQFYEPLLEKIDAMEIGIMARYLDIGKMYAKRILKEYSTINDDKLDELLDFLVYECPDHGYVVDYKILKPYLPSVIKANEAPFTDDYYKILERLSMLLMAIDVDDMIGFVSDLTAKPKTDGKIKAEEHTTDERPAKAEDTKAKRSGDKPDQNNGQEKHGQNQIADAA